ncbi:voltage-gated monoatomic cation channel TMEM109 [Amia ocellicauda]|uniref:voltage-gated monoatomic cation channel TMEM109 n=1 Tax=Amia ocellicauda TaxID=2972642 RepID=UPI00346404E9
MAPCRAALCVVALLCLGAQRGAGESQSAGSAPALEGLRYLLTEGCGQARRAAESLVGGEMLDSGLEYVQTAVGVVSKGAATGLNLLSGYCVDLINITGIHVPLQAPPHFTPDEVATVTLWGLGSLIAYWLLSLALRLVGGMLRQVLWLLKLALFLWAFLSILYRVEDPYHRGVLLAGLLCIAALFGGWGGNHGNPKLESRVLGLEKKVQELNKKLGRKTD